MAWKNVENYHLGFDLKNRRFLFYYRLQGENRTHQFNPTPEEFVGLSDMFRNEGPIIFNTTGSYFVTGPEAIGEEESQP